MTHSPRLHPPLQASTTSPEIKTDPAIGIRQFFNGNTLEEVFFELQNLRETTITESYGGLDKEDKWLMFAFFNRLEKLIEAVHVLHTNFENTKQ